MQVDRAGRLQHAVQLDQAGSNHHEVRADIIMPQDVDQGLQRLDDARRCGAAGLQVMVGGRRPDPVPRVVEGLDLRVGDGARGLPEEDVIGAVQVAAGAAVRIEDCGSRLGIENGRGDEARGVRKAPVGDDLLGIARIADRSDGVSRQIGEEPDKEGGENPKRHGRERGGRQRPEQDRGEDGQSEPKRHVGDADQEIDGQTSDLLDTRDDADGNEAHAGQQENHSEQGDADGQDAGEELAVDDGVAVDGLGDQLAQGPVLSLPIDGVESHDDPEERSEECDELDE